MISPDSHIRLRPSVAFVPRPENAFQFFQGNSRRSWSYKLRDEVAAALKLLDGSMSLNRVAAESGTPIAALLDLGERLHDQCLVETMEVARRIESSKWKRPLNFLGDFFPSTEVERAFNRIRETTVTILGVGAVGSWVATQLARTGFQSFVIVDPDVVEASNLNRSLYRLQDIGRYKTEALSESLGAIDPRIEVDAHRRMIGETDVLGALLGNNDGFQVVVNCADSPNVDVTSSLVNTLSQELGVPYVIAGGYNLHLSLIGMTVIPGQSACYQCGKITLDELQAGDLEGMRQLARTRRNIGNLGPLAAITASFAANEVLRLAVRSERLNPRMLNRRGEFNFLTNEMHFVELPARAECPCGAHCENPS